MACIFINNSMEYVKNIHNLYRGERWTNYANVNMYIDVVQIQFWYILVPGIIWDRKNDRQFVQFTGVLKPCKVTKYNINKKLEPF